MQAINNEGISWMGLLFLCVECVDEGFNGDKLQMEDGKKEVEDR